MVINMLCSAYGVDKNIVLEKFSELNNRNTSALIDIPVNQVVRAYAFIMECDLPSIPESEYYKSIQ